MNLDHDDYDAWLALFAERGFGPPRIADYPDKGWWPLIGSLLDYLKAMGLSKEDVQIQQVKEKLGGLRFYTYLRLDDTEAQQAIGNRVRDAEEQSYVTCERCGQPGALREGAWLKTLCDEHAAGRGVTTLE